MELLPVKVVAVDVEQLPSEISADHPHALPYRGLLMLVRRGGAPVRLALIPLSAQPLSRAEIELYLAGLATPLVGAADRFALPDEPMPISVVVCSTFAREDQLREALESISALTYPDLEILVVDNSRDGRAQQCEWLGALDRVRVLREARQGLSAARNCALQAARGTVIAFTDDDAVVDDGWLHALARRFAGHPNEVGIAGLILPKDLETLAQAAFERYYDGMSPRSLSAASYRLERPRHRVLSRAMIREVDDHGRVVDRFSVYDVGKFGAGANMAFRTSVLRGSGGFNTVLGAGTPTAGGEDIGLFARLAWQGFDLAFEPAALVFHRHREDDRALRRQIEAYGAGFIAMLFALIAEDRRHAGALLATAPVATWALVRSFATKLRRREGSEPSDDATVAELARIELRGMAKGPAWYFRSRRSARRLGA